MNILLYLVIVCIWGSTWLAINFQLGNVPITASIFYRFALASFFLFCWSLYKQSPLKFPLKTHLLFAFQGLFMFSLGYIAAYEAGGYISSGLNAIGFSLVLVFNIINGALFSKTPITSSIIMGALCGMVGITVIFWPSVATLDLTNASLFGIVLSVGAGFLASCGNMFATHIQKMHIPVTENNAYAMGYGALCTLLILFMEGSPLHFDFSLSYLASLLYLAVVGSVIAFGPYRREQSGLCPGCDSRHCSYFIHFLRRFCLEYTNFCRSWIDFIRKCHYTAEETSSIIHAYDIYPFLFLGAYKALQMAVPCDVIGAAHGEFATGSLQLCSQALR